MYDISKHDIQHIRQMKVVKEMTYNTIGRHRFPSEDHNIHSTLSNRILNIQTQNPSHILMFVVINIIINSYREMDSLQSSQSLGQVRQCPSLNSTFPTTLSKPRSLQSYDRFSGIIRGEWQRDDGRLQSICYGTGIAISKRVVLTCAHSVYLEKKRKLCDSISFIPSVDAGRLSRQQKVYTSAKQDFIRLELLTEGQTYSKFPIPEDVALIYLSEDLDLDGFPEVGVDSEEEVMAGGEVRVAGYPSLNYYTCAALREINFMRVPLNGKLLEVKENTIYHDLQTSTGHSGSGILGISTRTNQAAVLGVHTHKGKKRNSGVFLSNFVMRRLARYEAEFGLSHNEYDMSINFPTRIKEQIFMDLNEDEKETLVSRNKFYEKIWVRGEEEDFQNSEILLPFSLEDEDERLNNAEEEFSRMLMEECDDVKEEMKNDVEIAELAISNQKMIEKYLAKESSSKELLYQWLKLSNNFLQIYARMSEQTTSETPRHETLNKQLIVFCKAIETQLSEIKEKVMSMDKIEVIHGKFASVTEHLGRCYASHFDDYSYPQMDDPICVFQTDEEKLESKPKPIFQQSYQKTTEDGDSEEQEEYSDMEFSC